MTQRTMQLLVVSFVGACLELDAKGLRGQGFGWYEETEALLLQAEDPRQNE